MKYGQTIELKRVSVFMLMLALIWADNGARGAESILLDMKGGNWKGDATVTGGIDTGSPGDAEVYVVSADKDMNYPATLEFAVELKDGLGKCAVATVEAGYRSNSMMTREGRIFWDGQLLGTVDPYGGGESLRVATFEVDTAKCNFAAGAHKVRIEAKNTDNKWDFFQLDAMRIVAGRPGALSGGVSIPFELLTFADGNWEGDGNTWGGLDSSASLKADRGCVELLVKMGSDPARMEHPVRLSTDFAGKPVRVTVGYRRNDRMAQKATVLLDGRKIAEVVPFMSRAELGLMKDSVLETSSLLLKPEEHKLAAGKHMLSLEASGTGAYDRASFQIDAILIEEVPVRKSFPEFKVSRDRIACVNGEPGGPGKLAIEKFRGAAENLGTPLLPDGEHGGEEQSGRIVIGAKDAVAKLREKTVLLKGFQRRDAYLIEQAQGDGKMPELRVAFLEGPGLVWAMADLQARLRRSGHDVFIELPAGKDGGASEIFEYPAADTRGEYLNIGYNFPGITPHEWGEAEWRQYIDYLVMARLNTVYFFIWVDAYTMYPGSEGAKSMLNRKIHEGLRYMIGYAHERGLEVVYMITPSYSPRDVWMKHPEAKAEIEYVDHGFPAVCLNAPGAWERMKEIWRSEMEWFRESDAVQIWFYDPGGCWCEKNGCRKNQSDILARQVKEFGALFREFNPKARIEYNLWPIWLWEERFGKYRKDLSERVKTLFADNLASITAVGAAGTSYSLPFVERDLGLDGSAFIFGSNPESGYFFLMPNLKFHADTLREVMKEYGVTRVFGHRLEARTRMPATFFMAGLMWDPDAKPRDVVEKWAAWQMADRANASDLAETILLLDKYTAEGANPVLAERMVFLAERFYPAMPEAHREEMSYFPAMFRALRILADACATSENGAMNALCDDFIKALKSSPVFAPMALQGRMRFTNMKSLVCKGTNAGMF
ncbi:MAG: hypothetical protein WCK47_12010 [bacterium]|nr:hypothetical protein [Candidatus Sumerlaeota bacterium]